MGLWKSCFSQGELPRLHLEIGTHFCPGQVDKDHGYVPSSQLPLLLDPTITSGRYTLLSMFSKAVTSLAAHPALVYRMIAAALAQDAPAHPVCSGALLLVCALIVLDHAFM